MSKKRFVIECTDEQLDDLKAVVDYVIETASEHYDEWLQEAEDDDCHIYAKAVSVSKIEVKEIK